MIRSDARAAMQPRNAVVVDVEVLADQLAQQPMRVGDRARRPAARRPARPPAAPARRPARPGSASARARPSRASGSPACRSGARSRTPSRDPAARPRRRRRRRPRRAACVTPWRTSRTVSCVAAAPSIGVESMICSTGARVSDELCVRSWRLVDGGVVSRGRRSPKWIFSAARGAAPGAAAFATWRRL